MTHQTLSLPADAVRRAAYPLRGAVEDYDPLLDLIGDADFVLLGEASHGTHKFYRTRAEITQRLIVEQGFTAIAVEADWPDAYRVNRYVRGAEDDAEAVDALAGFRRFPQWIWRNADVLDFLGWLRGHNDALPTDTRKAGFYGLDLYSMYTSMEAVVTYLNRIDPKAAQRARERYACFEDFRADPQTYAHAARFGGAEPCEDVVVAQLQDLQRRSGDYARRDGRAAEDEYFFAEQNALLARDAEEYYRSMFRGRAASWNLRDRHMADTLDALTAHLSRASERTRVVVWEHNSHLGDARTTEQGKRGELNVGQLIRERHGVRAVLVGFTTYDGTVTAASDWDEPAERKQVRPALAESYEALFHETQLEQFILPIPGGKTVAALAEPRLERAIGVICRPETERWSHYVEARLPEQFDAILHFDRTRAVEPLERAVGWTRGEPPETYPTAV